MKTTFALCIIILLTAGCQHLRKEVLLKPVIDSDWWIIAPEPDLTGLGLQPDPDTTSRMNETNDHHIFRTGDGTWHLWACVRRTAVGRILAQWTADSLTQSPWTFTGKIIRASKTAGESLVDWYGQEFIQSPFIVQSDDVYYMFYGGYSTGVDPEGRPTTDYNRTENQISLMFSQDGEEWIRHQDERGYSRIFTGPGAVRDPCIVHFNDTWYAYYAGHHNCDRHTAGIYVRTSPDLMNWSDWSIAQFDSSCVSLPNRWQPESPFVISMQGYYYLFRTHGKTGAGTYVFRSKDPADFGDPDPDDKLVCTLPVIAPEIITDDRGNQYISNIRGPEGYGIRLARLRWETVQPDASQ